MPITIGNVAKNQTWAGTGTAPVTISLSAGSVLLVAAHQVGALNGSTSQTVSNVSSTNLVFVQVPGAARTHFDTNIGAGTPHQDAEVWWAFSSGALTSEVITVTSSGTPINGTITANEWKGVPNSSSPFDGNASLAATNDGDNSSLPATLTVSTNSSTPFGLFYHFATGPLPGFPSPWVNSGNTAQNLGTGGTNSEQACSDQQFAAQQSSATWTSNTGNPRNWIVIGVAFGQASASLLLPQQLIM